LYHYKSRSYSAWFGRFLSRDPIGYEGGSPNLYEYVASRPVSGVDPMGTQLALSSFVSSVGVLPYPTMYDFSSLAAGRELDAVGRLVPGGIPGTNNAKLLPGGSPNAVPDVSALPRIRVPEPSSPASGGVGKPAAPVTVYVEAPVFGFSKC